MFEETIDLIKIYQIISIFPTYLTQHFHAELHISQYFNGSRSNLSAIFNAAAE